MNGAVHNTKYSIEGQTVLKAKFSNLDAEFPNVVITI